MVDEENPIKTKSSTVHSVVVAVNLLEYLAESGRPQRVTDIATHLGMTKARVSRHLSTLADLELVVKTPDNSGYRLGSKLFRLASSALDQYEITNIAYRYMVVLKNRIGETILLAIPAGGDSLIVSTVSSGKPFAPKIDQGLEVYGSGIANGAHHPRVFEREHAGANSVSPHRTPHGQGGGLRR